MQTFIKDSIISPHKNYKAKDMNTRQAIRFYLFIVFFICLSSMVEVIPIIQQVNQDSQEIVQAIPQFDLDGGQLNSKEESYIHVTDTMIFAFDPQGKIDQNDIKHTYNLSKAQVSISLLSDRLSLNIMSLNEDIPYKQIKGLTYSSITTVLDQLAVLSPLTGFLVFIFSYIILLIYYLFEFVFLSLILYLISKLSLNKKFSLTLNQVFKISLASSTIPTFVFIFSNLIGLTTSYQYSLQLLFTGFLFFLAIRELKKTF